jgi:hypothetical protein
VVGALALATGLVGTTPWVHAAGKRIAATTSATAKFTSATAITGGYSFTSVSDPLDKTVPPFTQLLGINDRGYIVGYYGDGGTDTANPNKGFITAFNSLHVFTPWNYPNSVQTQVIGINQQNSTVGFYVDGMGVTHAYMTHGATFTTVDVPGTPSNTLNGINDLGQTDGFYQFGANNVMQPFTRQVDGTFVLPPIPNGQETGINNSGAVSGFFNDTSGNSHGFLLQNGVEKILNYPGAVSTQALGLNNMGLVVGTYTDSANNISGFIYNTTSGAWQTIQVPNANMTTIMGINDNGWIVGFYQTPSGATVGFFGVKATTLSIHASANPAPQGQPVTFTVSVSPSNATGTVSLQDGTTLLGKGTLSNGSIQFTASNLSAGLHTLVARYSGGSSYGPSAAVFTESIASAVATLAPQNGSTASGMAYLTPDTQHGQVDVFETVSGLVPNSIHPTHIHAGNWCGANGPILYVFPNLQANAQGVATIQYAFPASSIPATGWYINVHTGPTLAGNGATPISCGLVHPAGAVATTTSLTSSINPSEVTVNVTFTVNVSPNSATGTVQLLDGSTQIASGQLSGGSFTFTTNNLSQGSHTITAVYSGDGNNVGSTASLVQNVLPHF